MKWDLKVLIEKPSGEIFYGGSFERHHDAWKAVVSLSDGESIIRVKDERGNTRSLWMKREWLWK